MASSFILMPTVLFVMEYVDKISPQINCKSAVTVEEHALKIYTEQGLDVFTKYILVIDNCKMSFSAPSSVIIY